jgi:thioredoxin-related protein
MLMYLEPKMFLIFHNGTSLVTDRQVLLVFKMKVCIYCDVTAECRNSKAIVARQRAGKSVCMDANTQ